MKISTLVNKQLSHQAMVKKQHRSIPALGAALLLLSLTLLSGPGNAQASEADSLVSLNQSLASMSFSTADPRGVTRTDWQNSYQFSVVGRVLTVSFSEDAISYVGGALQDQYTESGSYTIDLRKTSSSLVSLSVDSQRLKISCQENSRCIGQHYDGVLYDRQGKLKTRKQAEKWIGTVELNVDPALLPGTVVDSVRTVIDAARGR